MNKLPDILKKIVKTKEEEVSAIRQYFNDLKQKIHDLPDGMDFKSSITNNALIAEVKKASPSAGIICEKFNPVNIALEYEQAGVNAISVLTDRMYFKGNIDYLKEIKKHVNIPVLRKDFIISEIQIYESKTIKADTFLLIARILTNAQLKEFIELGRMLKMEPLVEIHNINDLEKALSANASVIGINNRDLNSFTVNSSNTLSLIKHIPKDKIIVGESGINSIETARSLLSNGCNALLIGEFLMRSDKKTDLIKAIKDQSYSQGY